MEPMNMSPAGPIGGPPGSPVQYLPGFLLGDSPPPGAVEGGGASVAPGPLGLRSPPSALRTSLTPHLTPDYNRGTRTKVDGPPIAGLFDDITNKMNTNSPNTSLLETSCKEGEMAEGFWVVVYGFPQSHAAQVLALFSQLGRVVEQSFPNNGNWLFIKYQSRVEVRKALSYNEKVILGNVMIGVGERRTIAATVVPVTSSITPNRSLQAAKVVSPTTHKIRQLGVSPRDTTVMDPHMAPKKETSVVSKAIDLLLGW